MGWFGSTPEKLREIKETLVIACTYIPKVRCGQEHRKNVFLGAAMVRGRLVELNASSGGATERAEIWRKKGGTAFPGAECQRLIQAYYVYQNTDARSRTHSCRDKIIITKYF